MAPTFGCLGAGADALIHAVDFFSLHPDVLKAFVIGIDAVLQELAECHGAGGGGHERSAHAHQGDSNQGLRHDSSLKVRT